MSVAYRAKTGRSHLPDPHLDAPTHDWVMDPWGWTIHSLCGRVLRDVQPADWTENLCRMCATKAGER